MVVITGIKTAIKIAPIIYKVAKITYSGAKKTRQGQQWIARHPKALRYGTIAASSAPVIYDLLNVDYSAIQKTFPRRPKSKARNIMVKSRSERKYNNYCSPRYRNSSRRYY